MTIRLPPTGDPRLDAIPRGGLPGGSTHLVQAPPGAGKTTLALRFPPGGLRQETPLADGAQTLLDAHSPSRLLARRGIPTTVIVARRGPPGSDEGGTRLGPSLLGDVVPPPRMCEGGSAAHRSVAPVERRPGPRVTDVHALAIRPGGVAAGAPDIRDAAP